MAHRLASLLWHVYRALDASKQQKVRHLSATERPRTMPAPAVGNAFPTAGDGPPSCIANFSYAALFRFDDGRSRCYDQTAGWSSLVARWAHNPKVGGSNPPPATNAIIGLRAIGHLQQLSKTVQ